MIAGLDTATVSRDEVRFAPGDPAALESLLVDLRDRGAGAVFSGVSAIERDSGDVVVRFGDGPEPALQQIGACEVACHLHGVVPRQRPQPD